MEYQIVPLEIKNEVADFIELAERFRRIREEFNQKTSPEDRLGEIKKIDQLLEELGKVRRELKLQRGIMLGLTEAEAVENQVADIIGERVVEGCERSVISSIIFTVFLPCALLLIGLIGGELLTGILTAAGIFAVSRITFVATWPEHSHYDGVEFLMKYRLIRKTSQYRALKKAMASLKQLTISLKLTKLKLYI